MPSGFPYAYPTSSIHSRLCSRHHLQARPTSSPSRSGAGIPRGAPACPHNTPHLPHPAQGGIPDWNAPRASSRTTRSRKRGTHGHARLARRAATVGRRHPRKQAKPPAAGQTASCWPNCRLTSPSACARLNHTDVGRKTMRQQTRIDAWLAKAILASCSYALAGGLYPLNGIKSV